jgi:hypothetical protein
MDIQRNRDDGGGESPAEPARRFFVKAGSVNAVRRSLHRAPGGARVVGRYDRETIECSHTMDEHSFNRHWPVILSRLASHGLALVSRPVPSSDDDA